MPVRLVVGRTQEPQYRTVAVTPVLEMSRATAEPFWVQEIPGIYGLEPLARVAASLGLTGALPSPLPSVDAMDWDLINEASDAEIQLMIRHPAAILIPLGYEESLKEEPGSLLDLQEETERILQHMSGPPTLALALRDIGVEPFGLEWFAGKALLQACAIGLEMSLPLRYVWRYPLKDPKEPFTYYSASFWGLDEVAKAWIVDQGTEIHVRLMGGYVYRLPVEFAQTWFSDVTPTPGALAVECRFEPHDRYLEIELDNHQVLDISVASFLVWCEPLYDDLVAWTPEAEEKVRRGYEEYGPFRLEPK